MDFDADDPEFVTRIGNFTGRLSDEHYKILGMTTQLLVMAELGQSLYNEPNELVISSYGPAVIARKICLDLNSGKHKETFDGLLKTSSNLNTKGHESASARASWQLGFADLRVGISASKHTINPSAYYAFYFAESLGRFNQRRIIENVSELAVYYGTKVRNELVAQMENGYIEGGYEIMKLSTVGSEATYYAGEYLTSGD